MFLAIGTEGYEDEVIMDRIRENISYQEIVRSAIKDNIDSLFGSTHDEDNREYVVDCYYSEIDAICKDVSTFLVSCTRAERKVSLEELTGVLIYKWITFDLENVMSFTGFYVIANTVLNRYYNSITLMDS